MLIVGLSFAVLFFMAMSVRSGADMSAIKTSGLIAGVGGVTGTTLTLTPILTLTPTPALNLTLTLTLALNYCAYLTLTLTFCAYPMGMSYI